VAEFFGEMGGAMDVQPYEILGVFAAGDRVFVEGRNRGIVRATGRPYEHDWVMVITVRDGKITRVYHYYDSADLLPALRGE
jgi:ketosteroid isomerase-like protein